MQVIIIGHDGTDADAPARRQAVRPEHLLRARAAQQDGKLLLGGAFLDENDRMTGSVMVMEFESIEAARAWIEQDPYVTGRVWERFEVRPFRVADLGETSEEG